MKSVKFLTALCIAAMFTSCAKDEFGAQDKLTQSDKYVGADLLGTNVSMTVGFGNETKISGGDWETTDQLGLAWLAAANDFANPQAGKTLTATDNKLYANHMYSYVGNGSFTSKGNIYEGWHYAYFPFVYEAQAGQLKSVVVNPTQKVKGLAASRNEMLHLSGAAFLTKKDNLDGAMNLVGVDYVLEPAFSVIGVTVNPSETFTGSATLKKSKITGITLKVEDKNMFAKTVEVQGSELDNLAATAQGTTAKAELLNSFGGVLEVKEYADTVYTKVENSDITLKEAQQLRFFVKPGQQSFSVEDVTITVYVEGGKFTISYLDPEDDDYTAAHGVNNDAIEALVDAYKIDGTRKGCLTDVNGGTAGVRGLALNLELAKSMFTVDFGGITTASEWNQCVNIANDLNKTSVTFNLDGKIEIEEGVELLLPNASTFKVKTDANSVNAGVYVGSDYFMSKALATALSNTTSDTRNNLIVVKEGATLTLAQDDKLTSANEAAVLNVSNLTNAGTINLGYHSTIKNLYNDNGRVNVMYGSYVEQVKSENKGIIAYIATGNDSAAEINELMGQSGQNRYATINTIVVNEGITFSLETAYKGDSEYGAANTLDSDLLETMTVEMNGGTLVDGTVAAIKVLSGDSNILNNVFAADLNVNAGAVTVKSTKVNNAIKEIEFGKIYNKAVLVADTDIYTVELTTDAASETFAENGAIYYNNRTSQNGHIYGKVTDSPYGTGNELPGVVKVFNGKALIDNFASTNIKFGANITLPTKSNSTAREKGRSYDLNIAGKNIDGNGYSINTALTTNDAKSSTVGQTAAVFVVDNSSATIKNIVFASENSRYDVNVKDGATLNATDCKFITATTSSMKSGSSYLGKRALYISGTHGILNINGGEFDDKVYAFNDMGATNAASNVFKFKNVVLKGWMSASGTHTFENCTFAKSGDYQNYVPYGTAEFTKCKFDENFVISVKHARQFTFTNCTRGYVAVENPANLKWDISGSGNDWTEATKPAENAIKATVNTVNYGANVVEFKEGDAYDTVKLTWSKLQ